MVEDNGHRTAADVAAASGNEKILELLQDKSWLLIIVKEMKSHYYCCS